LNLLVKGRPPFGGFGLMNKIAYEIVSAVIVESDFITLADWLTVGFE
jgi:hypothetical protein